MKQAAYVCLTVALTTSPVLAGEYGSTGGSVSGIAGREMARRMARVQEAQAMIERGDQLYAEGDYEGAYNQYKSALDLLPDAPMTAALREVAVAKFCEASVALAGERAENGRYQEARSILNEALLRDPNCEAATQMLVSLDDPDRYEPALTAEHVKNVEDVNRDLKLAYSYMNLGDLDRANKTFENVLRVDKYNSAARRGMERVEQEKSRYYSSARDHRRGKMLAEVDKVWEDQVPVIMKEGAGNIYVSTSDGSRYYTEKMSKIIFPSVTFSGATLDEAIEYLRIKSKEFDTVETDPGKRGVNLILSNSGTPSTASINMDLRDVPMSEALRYITEFAGMKFRVEPYAVVVVPISSTAGGEQITRTFKVPPSFLNMSGDSGGGGSAVSDPFGGSGAATSANASSLGTKPTAKQILEQNGITFPDGASAMFVASTSQLVVRNTQPNLEAVEAFVESLVSNVPRQLFITTKFVEVTQKNTDELGFDWLVGPFNIGGNRTFGSGGSGASGSDYPMVIDGTPVGGSALTNGLRSGTGAITPDSIDGLLAGLSGATSKAPGMFALAGVFTDPQFQVVMRALSQKKGVDLMSAPSITTRSGQRATVEVIREFIYPTEFDPPQIPQQFGNTTGTTVGLGSSSSSSFPVTPTTPTTFEMRPVGVRMEVDPVYDAVQDVIDLNLAPEVTEFEGFINYGSPIQTSATNALGVPISIVLTENRIEQPVFSTRKVTTAVSIWDGATVALGGLMREDVQDVEDKVPLLGDIPFVGRLFQSKAEDHFKRNLMIFVTAKLIDPSGQDIRKEPEATPALPPGPVSMDGPGILPPYSK